ncbi:MAG: hypothetical protein P9L99_04140 [Candidatus Lernaella stagnicola]|nr:hypothetical protein [Candidatus Lernaella stagnicola]
MQRHYFLIVFVALLTLAFAAPATAETFVIFPIKASAKYRNDARVMTKLLRNELENLPQTKVYGTQGESCSDVGCAKQIRKKRGVDAVIVGELTTLGGQLTLLLDAAWADEVYSYDTGLADVTEFKKLRGRLAKAIRNRDDWAGGRGVDSVAQDETHPYRNKVHGMWKFGLAMGMVAPMSDTYLGADYLIGGKLGFRYEIANVGIEGAGGYYGSSNLAHGLKASEIPIELGAHYYFMNSDISPFLGAKFGAHAIFLDHRDTDDYYSVDDDRQDYWMFTVAPYLGVELLRTHTFNINFRAGYQYGFVNFDEADAAPDDVKNGAHGVFFQVGVTFGGN